VFEWVGGYKFVLNSVTAHNSLTKSIVVSSIILSLLVNDGSHSSSKILKVMLIDALRVMVKETNKRKF